MLKRNINILLLILLGTTNLFSQDTTLNQEFNKEGRLIREVIKVDTVRIVIDYYENGSQKSSCPYIDGEIHGLYKAFYSNGEKKSEIDFNRGVKHGKAKFYYLDGAIHSYIEYSNNIYHGKYILYDRKGNVTSILIYDNGKKLEEKDTIQ